MNTSIGRTTASPPVLVAVDGSSNSHAALTWAAHEARSRHARLRIVHACPAPSVWDPTVLAHMAPEHTWIHEQGLRVLGSAVELASSTIPKPRGRHGAAPGQPGAGHPRREQAGNPDRPGPWSQRLPVTDRGCCRAMQRTGERGRHRRHQRSVVAAKPGGRRAAARTGRPDGDARARRGPHPGASACLAADRHGGLDPTCGWLAWPGPSC